MRHPLRWYPKENWARTWQIGALSISVEVVNRARYYTLFVDWGKRPVFCVCRYEGKWER